jgi:hypothetical protein
MTAVVSGQAGWAGLAGLLRSRLGSHGHVSWYEQVKGHSIGPTTLCTRGPTESAVSTSSGPLQL